MKKIVEKFNNLIKKTIFKVQNKTNNNFKISNFNKYLITSISLLFLYLFYLLTPLLYEKSWVQTSIENKLLNEFRINLSASANIAYRILPAPHFLVKDSKILVGVANEQKSIAEIKDLKVFISQSNFFDKEKMNIKKVIINNANFSLFRNDLKLLNRKKDKNFSSKKIRINNSKIFFNNDSNEIISIIKVNKAFFFFGTEKLLNLFNLNGEVFNIPFIFDFKNQNNPIKSEEINFKVNALKLNIFNESLKKNNSISGKNIISFLNSTINTRYNVKEKLIIFNSESSKAENSRLNYSGDLSINPFDLNLKVNLDKFKISKLFNSNSILTELVKSGILLNDSISVNTSIIINSNISDKIIDNAEINFSIINGKIDFNNTRFVNDDIGSFKLSRSNLLIENNKLVLNTDVLIDVRDHDRLFSFLNTNKKSRIPIKKIFINLDYDFLNNQTEFNNIRIDNNEISDQLLTIIEGFNDNSSINLNKSRRLLNKFLDNYEG